MSYSAHRVHRLLKDAVLFFLSGLLGLASCSSGSIGSQPTLTLSPSIINLTAGGTGQTAALLLTAPAGTGATTVAVSGLPSGVTLSPATLSVTPGAASPLTFTAASSAVAATTMATFTASSNGQSVSTQASLSVQAAPPPPADFSLRVTPRRYKHLFVYSGDRSTS